MKNEGRWKMWRMQEQARYLQELKPYVTASALLIGTGIAFGIVSAVYAPGIVTAYRKRIQFIQSANDERDLWNWRSLHFKKLKGNRSHQHSIRLNDQYRLIVEITGTADDKVVNIIAIEDYHD